MSLIFLPYRRFSWNGIHLLQKLCLWTSLTSSVDLTDNEQISHLLGTVRVAQGFGFCGGGTKQGWLLCTISSLSVLGPRLPFYLYCCFPCQLLSGVSSVHHTPCLVHCKCSGPVWKCQHSLFSLNIATSIYFAASISHCVTSLPLCAASLGHAYKLTFSVLGRVLEFIMKNGQRKKASVTFR